MPSINCLRESRVTALADWWICANKQGVYRTLRTVWDNDIETMITIVHEVTVRDIGNSLLKYYENNNLLLISIY